MDLDAWHGLQSASQRGLDHLHRLGLPQALGSGQRGVGHVGIRAVDDHRHPDPFAPLQRPRIARRDDQAGTDLATVHSPDQGVLPIHVRHQVKVARSPEGIDQGPAAGAVIPVQDGRGQVPHVGRGRVAQEQKLHDRDKEHHGQRPGIAHDVEDLLARDGQGAGQHCLRPRLAD